MIALLKKKSALWVLALMMLTGTGYGSDSLIFVIRVDDIQSRNTTYLPRSISDFEQMVAARGAKVTWAVIPHRLIETQNSDGKLAAELRESIAAGNEVVLHGYNHICPLCNYTNHEMYCTTYRTSHSYRTQSDMITDGLQLLADSVSVTPQTFVPPGHQADTITYQVLLDLGFKWISTTGGTREYIYRDLFNLSPQIDYTWSLSSTYYYSRLEETLADVAEKGEAMGYYCLLLHDPFIRPGYADGLVIRWTGELLDSLLARYGERVSFMTLSEAAAQISRITCISSDEDPFLETGFQLNQNYPNPFNAVTTIPLYLPERGDINLTLYDIRGRVIRRFSRHDLPAGPLSYRWDAREQGSGIYFYRVVYTSASGTGFTKTKRCLLLK